MSRTASREAPRNTSDSPSYPGRTEISLLDHTVSKHLSRSNTEQHDSDTEQSDSEASLNDPKLQRTLSKKLTNSSLQGGLRRAIERQKYARYQSYRYGPSLDTQVSAEDFAKGDPATQTKPARQPDLLERGRARAAALLRGRRKLRKEEERDAVVDVLYENQRGSFFFGVPRYSSNSLLQIDAKPWQNADFRTSAVDIRNAQVPDPSWEWSWNSWYVDMNRDVDEQGWEYSFAFGNQFAWHGSHPWFYSFVRRRRWLRKRIRKDRQHKTKERGHELAPDYFTIHTKVLSTGSQADAARLRAEEDDLNDEDIADAGSLAQHIRAARLDREKLRAIGAFMKAGSTDDIDYLAQQMTEIMSTFIYQSSRRQLLAELMQHHANADRRRDELAQHDHSDEESNAKHDAEEKRATAILSAVQAADKQIQKLEYWSDIKDMSKIDETLSKDKAVDWESKRWRGLRSRADTASFSSKQDVDAPAAALHDKPEKHIEGDSETDSSAYTTAPSLAPSTKSRPAVAEKKRPSVVLRRDDTDNSLERFVTASEGPVSTIKPKQYRSRKASGKAGQLDGVEEEDKTHEEELKAASKRADHLDEDEAQDDESPLHEVSAEDSLVVEA